jgi:hypothetical protein
MTTALCRRELRTVAIVAVALALIIIALTTGLLTIDHFDGVYGVSIGSNNYYCSIEDKLPVFACEHAA